MRSGTRLSRPAGFVVTGAILLSLVGAGDVAASTHIRFLHAVPGGPGANLTVAGAKGPRTKIRNVAFGHASSYAAGPHGRVALTLSAGGKKLAGAPETLVDNHHYTVVAEKGRSGIDFKVYRAGKAVAGKVRLRAVHAAPEVGKVDMTVGSKKWGTIGFGQTTGYKGTTPGTYDVAARMPGKQSVLVQAKGLNAAAGTASTAYAVGSSGERTRIVLVQDSVAAPKGAPETGLGGMSRPAGDTPWLAALLAALGAGTLGGVAYSRRVNA